MRGGTDHPVRGEPHDTVVSLTYEIRVRGRVEDHLAEELGLAARVEPVETILQGAVTGQDQLHDLLSQLQDMGLELVEIRQLPPGIPG